MKSLVIRPNKSSLKGLESFADKMHFASSSMGWVNKNIFIMFSLRFVADIQYYRLILPPSLRSMPILLLVDGHKSRISYSGVAILKIFDIDFFVFPGHCLHVLQPFDAAVFSFLKTVYKSELLRCNIDKMFLVFKIQKMSAIRKNHGIRIIIDGYRNGLYSQQQEEALKIKKAIQMPHTSIDTIKELGSIYLILQ